jgi:orotate phosphoribosyltransferase
MKDSLRRLLHRISVDVRDPETDEPFTLASGGTTWTYLDVRKTVLLPHGLWGLGNLLLQSYLEDDNEDILIGAVAGPALGGIPLASAFMLAAYEYDQSEAPPMLLVRKQAKDHGTQNLVEGLDNVDKGTGVLIVEDVVTKGGSTILTIESLRAAGVEPKLVIAIVDREAGGLARIKEETGVEARALFTMTEILNVSPDDHILFIPNPNEDGEGFFMQQADGQGWGPCSPEQNGFLNETPAKDRISYQPEHPDEERLGTHAFGMFYVEGVLKP